MPKTTDPVPGCLGWLFSLLGLGGASKTEPAGVTGSVEYRLRDSLLTPAERSLYGVLVSVVGVRAVVCPKPRIGDLIQVQGNGSEQTIARNRISQKHVDFVLCAPGTMRPLFAIELDDKSHTRPERQARDAQVDAAFQGAGLVLLHVPNRSGYVYAELTALLAPHLPGIVPGVVTPPTPAVAALPALADETNESGTPPTCPKCGVPMVARTAARGERQGQSFFGCPNYPRCRETRPLA